MWGRPEVWGSRRCWERGWEAWVGEGGAPAVTVRLAEVVVSKNAVMVTDVLFPTANVVTVKLADVCPPGTLTMPGARATFALLVASVTEIPPAGAGALKKHRAGGIRAAAHARRS